jgi:hypothetical protein
MDDPAVTIGVIAAETGEALAATLASLRVQHQAMAGGGIELIVLAPEDPEEAGAQWIEARPEEPIALRSERLLTAARGKYLLVLDERVRLNADYVAKAVAYLEAHRDAVAVYGQTVFEYDGVTEARAPVAIQSAEPPRRVEMLLRRLDHVGPFYGLRRMPKGVFPMKTAVGVELYDTIALAWTGGLGAVGDIACHVSGRPGFLIGNDAVARYGCPAYQAEDPALWAMALVFCGLGMIERRYAALHVLERLRIAVYAEEAIRAQADIHDDVLMIPFASRLFREYNVTQVIRDIRIKTSEQILKLNSDSIPKYMVDIVNCFCRFRIGNLSPDRNDAALILRIDKILNGGSATVMERNKAALVTAMYY